MTMTIHSKLSLEKTMQEISKFHFILDEGRKGHHLLFHPESIRRALSRQQEELSDIFEQNLDPINEAMNEMFARESFEEKREFLETLPQDIQDALVFGYFQLLEGGRKPSPRELN